MTTLSRPNKVAKGQLLWLELEELPDRPKVAVRVFAVLRSHRIQVEIMASDQTLITVDEKRLLEEVAA